MSTITITNVEPRIQKVIIAVCKALGVASYQVTNDEKKAATDLHEQKMAATRDAVHAHLRGDRTGAITFENADAARKHYGL